MRHMPPDPAPLAAAPPAPSPAAAPRPRVWTPLLAYAVVVVGAVVGSAAVAFGAMFVRTLREPGLAQDPAAAGAVFGEVIQSAGVFLAGALVIAAVQVAVALAAAGLSREKLRARLLLVRPRLGAAAYAVAAVGGLAVSSVFDSAFGVLGIDATGTIGDMKRVVVSLSPAGLLAAVAAGGIAAPAAEELFFRGYVQGRLCRRWGAWAGVVVTSALFGLIHLDWIHSPSAFLIGLYLGWLAARAGSILPSVVAHAVNNTLWVVGTWAGIGSGLARGTHAALLVVLVACAVAAIAWLRPRLGGPETGPSSPEPAA